MMSHTIGGTKTSVFDLSRGLVDACAFDFPVLYLLCLNFLLLNTNLYVDMSLIDSNPDVTPK